jgi:excisionase family DNA binding protein
MTCPKLFFTRIEAASILRLSMSSVQRRIKEGRPPFHRVIRVGKRVLVPRQDIYGSCEDGTNATNISPVQTGLEKGRIVQKVKKEAPA